MNRTHRQAVAAETLQILQQGGYTHEGRLIDFAEEQRAGVESTQLFTPSQLDRAVASVTPDKNSTLITVANETTFAAAWRLAADPAARVAALNFASAKNPGGGFQSGASAQEESLARASTLYASLLAARGYYDANRAHRDSLYTDHAIFSPDVIVFRDDEDALLSEPYNVDIVTMAAPNAGAVLRQTPHLADEIEPTMARRISKVLALAAIQGNTHLVLGAWGCGVFKNDPATVAELWNDAIQDRFAGVFEQVHFAVYDSKGDTFASFEKYFAD